jgi:hypothetical protein
LPSFPCRGLIIHLITGVLTYPSSSINKKYYLSIIQYLKEHTNNWSVTDITSPPTPFNWDQKRVSKQCFLEHQPMNKLQNRGNPECYKLLSEQFTLYYFSCHFTYDNILLQYKLVIRHAPFICVLHTGYWVSYISELFYGCCYY